MNRDLRSLLERIAALPDTTEVAVRAGWIRDVIAERDDLADALMSLAAEGWFAPWSDDPRVVAIRAILAEDFNDPRVSA